MKAVDDIVETLRSADNEGTAAPYWLLIDPKNVLLYAQSCYANDEEPELDRVKSYIESAIEGPFFSREDAKKYLEARAYEYSDKAYIYCHSGYWSKKYKNLCREIGIGT